MIGMTELLRSKLFTRGMSNSGSASYEIEKGLPAPDVNLIKAFVRWYMLSARGRARTGVLPSMRRVLVCIERFDGGLRAIARNAIPKEERLEIYKWIKNDSDSLISEAAEEAHVLNALLLVSLK